MARSKKYEVVTTTTTDTRPQGHGPFDTKPEAERYAERLTKSQEYATVKVRQATRLTAPPAALSDLFRL